MDTLILNADGTPLSILPLSIIDWQKALKLTMLEKTKVIKHHENWIVRSPSISMCVPSIIMVCDYIRHPKHIKYTRFNVYLRDDFTCQLQITNRCANKHGKGHLVTDLTLDHVLPKSLGGKGGWTNIITACADCNMHKGKDEKIKPKKNPKNPTYYEMMDKRKKFPVTVRDLEWLYYLNWDEELVYLNEPKGEKPIKLTEWRIKNGN